MDKKKLLIIGGIVALLAFLAWQYTSSKKQSTLSVMPGLDSQSAAAVASLNVPDMSEFIKGMLAKMHKISGEINIGPGMFPMFGFAMGGAPVVAPPPPVEGDYGPNQYTVDSIAAEYGPTRPVGV